MLNIFLTVALINQCPLWNVLQEHIPMLVKLNVTTVPKDLNVQQIKCSRQ